MNLVPTMLENKKIFKILLDAIDNVQKAHEAYSIIHNRNAENAEKLFKNIFLSV